MNYIDACNILGVTDKDTDEDISAKYYILISKYALKNVSELFYDKDACLLISAYYCIKRYRSNEKRNVKSR